MFPQAPIASEPSPGQGEQELGPCSEMGSRQQTPHFQKVCLLEGGPLFKDTAGHSYALTEEHTCETRRSSFKRELGEAKIHIATGIFPSPRLNPPASPLQFLQTENSHGAIRMTFLRDWIFKQSAVRSRCFRSGGRNATAAPLPLSIQGPGLGCYRACAHCPDTAGQDLGGVRVQQGPALPLPVSCSAWQCGGPSHQNQDVTRLSVSLGGHRCVRTQAADKQAICSLSVEDRSRAEQSQKSTSQQERLSSKPSTHQFSIMSNPMEKSQGRGKQSLLEI